ncbi:MAG: carbohydrate ABC transporter permease [Defluviitoga tunisiensis]|uniref:Glycerol-3-phosphate transporter membrane protein n=1 Tax=Defluviitoga tunisiensis TaxID=1006576 RepID=A0A0C7NIK7_DEFTU|nr:carbohydrate ABC transporter permease [Defluviitoga tunisiensis]MDD3600834.1 carbohydrate ABC transporter permease [Defluviitoga tunisiensis]MDY0379696.1 carbohydrate ABC transporter permease [Defluviitoga tunisiensis]CEP77766.1 glycerol-3-phosphate transporter membrane protein [Defluviitoga tunisiensis]HPU60266.1 carbohydrate ABC transporter permease [Defluviitoga tunisiensis]HQD43777.1 carbohydrate ABC transporter permease [Defluviitoga tunisiensis]
MKISSKKKINYVLIEVGLIIVSIIMFLPFFLAVSMSFMSEVEVFSYPPKFLPSQINFKNYKEALDIMNLKRMLLNSFIVATCTTLGKIITGTLGAFAFSSFNFKGKNTLFFTLFITLFLPAETVMILPLFMIMSKFGWVNTYWALIIPFTASATNTFLFRQHFMSIPTELEDAAKIDGATPMQYFRKILIPLSGPMIAGASIINFVYAWNMYLWPLIVTMDNKMKTVQIGVKMLIATDSTNNWGIIMAGTLMAALPTLILFFVLQDLFVKSLVTSGLKG